MKAILWSFVVVAFVVGSEARAADPSAHLNLTAGSSFSCDGAVGKFDVWLVSKGVSRISRQEVFEVIVVPRKLANQSQEIKMDLINKDGTLTRALVRGLGNATQITWVPQLNKQLSGGFVGKSELNRYVTLRIMTSDKGEDGPMTVCTMVKPPADLPHSVMTPRTHGPARNK